MLKLKAKTENERLILEYIKRNATDDLVEKINSGVKTLSQCWSYIVSEAKKLAQNNCACVEDSIVFGWAMHFFEEDAIDGKTFAAKDPVKTKTDSKSMTKSKERKVSKPTKPQTVATAQLSLFDM